MSTKHGLTLALSLIFTGPVAAQVSPQVCGKLNPNPWDYRVEKRFHALVEDAHFTPDVENLIRGRTGALPAPDIEYTLSVFPNHHRAIIAATKLSERDQTNHRNQLPRPVECYYERALRFRPDDSVVRMLYARFLHKRKRHPEAMGQIEEALRRTGDNPLSKRNAGLVLIEMEEFDRALVLAHELLNSEYADTVLKTALEALGRWRELPVAEPASAVASGATP